MSFLTDLTPLTVFTSSTALLGIGEAVQQHAPLVIFNNWDISSTGMSGGYWHSRTVRALGNRIIK
jgi:hypothetical protein